MNQEVQHHQCSHHHSINNDVDHIIHLLQHKFISPYRILYMIDQKQADYFKARNGISGCCANSVITIQKEQMSKLERIVLEVVSRGYLLAHLQKIMQFCHQRYSNIIQGGKQNNLEVNEEVEKYLLDKVLSQGINLYLLKAVNQEIESESRKMNTGLGLWATPATWYSQYPSATLNYLSQDDLYSLSHQSYAISKQFISEAENLLNELTLLEKDGRFEEILFKNSDRNDNKVLTCPQTYINQGSSRESLKVAVLKLKSIPFELNLKMNCYCLVSETIHISYFQKRGFLRCKKQVVDSIHVLVFVGSIATIFIKNMKDRNQKRIACGENDLCMIGTQIDEYRVQLGQKECFMFRYWINLAEKNK